MDLLKRKSSGIIRSLTVFLAVVLQIVTLYLISSVLKNWSNTFYLFLEIVSIILVFALVNDSESYKQFWIIIVLVLPVLGLFLYYVWGRKRTNSPENKRYREIFEKGRKFLVQDPNVIEDLTMQHPNRVQISRFLANEGYPMYSNTEVKYFEIGEVMLSQMMEEMKTAKRFLFLEYFIISEGEIWKQAKEIMAQKVQEGVDVRLLMDDFGCLVLNTPEFRQEMAKLGIRVNVFAPIHRDVSRLSFNYRNHQKITIIDGNIGYCGGINLADEYANIIERFGHWKDTAVRLEGDGVWSLTCIFLEMWEISRSYEELDYAKYKPTVKLRTSGFVQPLADGPANNPDNPAEGAYIHMINKAREYIYITTPYLVLENKMAEDLCRAARSGVDVRIITPRIYDKWYVYMVNIYNYGKLLANGVKVYEYVPGFIHSKTVVSDDECAICGSINMDYRSFYLHYECGVYMCDCQAVLDIRKDIQNTLKECEEIQYESWKQRPFYEKIIQWILKIFSPML